MSPPGGAQLRAGRPPREGAFRPGLVGDRDAKDGHHPIIFMQCRPVRHRVDARAQAAARPFEHTVIVRPTLFHSAGGTGTDQRVAFQALYQFLVDDETRNRMICEEISGRAGGPLAPCADRTERAPRSISNAHSPRACLRGRRLSLEPNHQPRDVDQSAFGTDTQHAKRSSGCRGRSASRHAPAASSSPRAGMGNRVAPASRLRFAWCP